MVGISQKVCPCFDGQILPAQNVSTSGLYIDELDGGITLDSIKSIADCSSGLAGMFVSALAEAQIAYRADLMAQISSTQQRKYDPFAGSIGSLNFARTKYLTQNITALRIKPRNIWGAYMRIKAVSLFVDATTTITVRLLEAKRDQRTGDVFITELQSYDVPTLANQASKHVVPAASQIRVPMWDNTGYDLEYYFAYDRTTLQNNAKDNQIRCNCGQSEQRLQQYITAQGVEVAVLQDLMGAVGTQEANGIIPEVEIYCGSEDVICDAIAIDEGIKLTTAYAIRFKAGELLLGKILASPEVNRYTMSNREYLYGRKNHFRAEYFTRIQWIQENMDFTKTDCYTCAEKPGGAYKRGILIT